ncbi:MarR family transcriptional regulator [Agromyces sp. H66]|uniref:MarR family winged helix-turn-helix transcriptional regulator n=1 Tax=Agromyces sp. H66 TaxID=2529859 RepID=UPI0010A9C732|nr:MarR family transcriptional regulator [Agromyces sp. H66]
MPVPDEGAIAPEIVIERALVRIRRDQQARRLHRRDARDANDAGDSRARAAAADAARFRYLDALDETGDGRSISEIADAIGIDRPRASRLTTELLADGLIRRTTAPDDARYARIELSADGKEIVDRVHDARRRNVTEALAGFTDQEARVLAELLDRFVESWPRGASAAPPRPPD